MSQWTLMGSSPTPWPSGSIKYIPEFNKGSAWCNSLHVLKIAFLGWAWFFIKSTVSLDIWQFFSCSFNLVSRCWTFSSSSWSLASFAACRFNTVDCVTYRLAFLIPRKSQTIYCYKAFFKCLIYLLTSFCSSCWIFKSSSSRLRPAAIDANEAIMNTVEMDKLFAEYRAMAFTF